MIELVASAIACPDCWLGRQARSDFLHEQFAFHLFALVLPFLATVALSESVFWFGRTPSPPEHEAPK